MLVTVFRKNVTTSSEYYVMGGYAGGQVVPRRKNPHCEVACGKTEVEGIAKRSNWCTSYAETYKILLVR
jgi:hypothetical protein